MISKACGHLQVGIDAAIGGPYVLEFKTQFMMALS
jgi:hypothetical protein